MYCLGNQSWRDHLLECRQQLATDLAHVVDQLVMILGDVISKDECDKIKSFSNPVKKTDALIEAILTRDDPKMYAEFAEGVKVVKPGKWSEELLTYLD